MRPDVLRLSAFGAYAGRQEIDFAALGAHRLFLIHGPTGSGKTTLLDAICYALFGKSSGGEREAPELRSHHAATATPTVVELDFSLGGERYRVRRSPAQTVPGRGGRPVSRSPQVTLWRRGPDGELAVIAEKTEPVSERLRELLGYTADEFRQVVMLPQGRFRELLVAGRDERKAILATLFRTAFFKRVEGNLEAMEKAARGEAEAAQVQRATLLGEAGEESLEAAEAAAEALAGEAEQAAGAAEVAARRAKAAERRLEAAHLAVATLKAAEVAAGRLAGLEAERPHHEAGRLRLAAAGRAQALAGERAALLAAEAEAARAGAAEAEARTRAGEAEARLRSAEAALAGQPARERSAEAFAAEAARLEALMGQAVALSRAVAEAAEARARLGEAEAAAAEAAARHATAAGAAAEAAGALAHARALAGRGEEHRSALALAEALARDREAHANAVREAARLAGEREAGHRAHAAAAALLLGARKAREAAERAADEAAAAHLAVHLAEGEPCPVCGSPHHPSPARHAGAGGGDLAAARAEEEGRARAEREAHAAFLTLDARSHAVAGERDRLAERLAAVAGGAGTAGESGGGDVTAARLALAEAEEAGAMIPSLAARAGSAEAAEAEAGAARRRSDDALRAARERVTATEAARDARREAVPEEARDEAALAALAAAAREEAKRERAALDRDRAEHAAAAEALGLAHDARAAAARAAESAAAAAQQRQRLFADALARAGFADAEAFEQAGLGESEAEALAAVLAGFGEKLAVAREAAARAREAAAGLTAPDIASLTAEAEAAREAGREAGLAEGMARQRAGAAAERLGRLRAADRAFAGARARHGLVAGLASGTRGMNGLSMSFEDFVLTSLLEEALVAANLHLARMLGGRYRLLVREEPVRARAKAGLDIEVLDEWTGQKRTTGTLSGGEGFCAALALALGLSETVQAHAGARRIDTLLIDEGFGSLDDEALDKAMDVLSSLDMGGRVVGIISHVGELRARIPARLEVTPGPRGSTARLLTG